MNKQLLSLLTILSLVGAIFGIVEDDSSFQIPTKNKENLQSKDFWIHDGQFVLREKLTKTLNTNIAKNVILFFGDGMSIPSITATRIYDGQLKGIVGERHRLILDRFEEIGLVKTYCADYQVAEAACAATSILSGVKGNHMTLGVTPDVKINDCAAAFNPENQLESIFTWAQETGKSTGLVTTTRVTHASAAAIYAHSANSSHESDADVLRSEANPNICDDIAAQLIEEPVGKNLQVILGGGHGKFVPKTMSDVEGKTGERSDERNLIQEWIKSKNESGVFVTTKDDLNNLNVFETEYLLGLFASSHIPYHLDAVKKIPTLTEMTEAALKILSKNSKGYFAFIEGGRIGHGHHEGKAAKALDETIQFTMAIEKALEMTDEKDTLIIVTSNYGHTLTISGYGNLDNNILGLSTNMSDVDGMPYTTLNYANGPNAAASYSATANQVRRVNLSKNRNIGKKDFVYPQLFPLSQGSHDGSDVAIYANGPWAHLFGGVNEQTVVPALIGYASCTGPGLKVCDNKKKSGGKRK